MSYLLNLLLFFWLFLVPLLYLGVCERRLKQGISRAREERWRRRRQRNRT